MLCVHCKKERLPAEFKTKLSGKVNKGCIYCAEKAHEAYLKNQAARQAYQLARYYTDLKEDLKAYQRDWRAANAEHHADWNKENHKKKMATDARYRAIFEARGRALSFLLRSDLTAHSNELGCTVSELRQHLEALFQPGMTWENRSWHGWHLDHHFPLSKAYDAGEEVFKKALLFKNLRPVWKEDNMAKCASIPSEYQTIEDFLRS